MPGSHSPAPAIHHTLYHTSEIETISFKEDSFPSPTKEKSKAQRRAILCMRSHSQKGEAGRCTQGIQKDRTDW